VALGRCRSYRQDNSIPCTVIAVNNKLITLAQSHRLASDNAAKITFLHQGFAGSYTAGITYVNEVERGYIWLVDRQKGRDCKGEWQQNSWWVRCQDGLSATGTLQTAQSGSGNGSGIDSNGKRIDFVFFPAKQ